MKDTLREHGGKKRKVTSSGEASRRGEAQGGKTQEEIKVKGSELRGRHDKKKRNKIEREVGR